METPKTTPALALERGDQAETTGQEDDCKDAGAPNSDQAWMILNAENVLRKIGKIGSQADFYELRQVNDMFYEILNPAYFNDVEPCCMPTSKLIFSQASENIGEDNGVSIFHVHPLSMVLELRTYKNKDRINKSVKYSLLKIIPVDKLANYEHIFRTLDLTSSSEDLQEFESHKLTHQLFEICTQLSPYITTLDMTDTKLPDSQQWNLSEFINIFTNLSNLKLNVIPSPSMKTLDDLEILLDSLQSKPKFFLDASAQAHHVEVLTKFGTRPNTTIELSIREPFPNNHEEFLDHFQNISIFLSQFPNVKVDCSRIQNFLSYEFSMMEGSIRDIAHLQTFTSLWTQYGKHLDLHLRVLISATMFPNGNELKNCSIQLSPYIKHLTLRQESWEEMYDLNMDCKWPKLAHLEIFCYKYPLEILKQSPNLYVLNLSDLDQESSIFSNKQQSHEENLQEYFGNLPNLEYLYLHTHFKTNAENEPIATPEDNIIEFYGLGDYLKGLLPKLKIYTVTEQSFNGETIGDPEILNPDY